MRLEKPFLILLGCFLLRIDGAFYGPLIPGDTRCQYTDDNHVLKIYGSEHKSTTTLQGCVDACARNDGCQSIGFGVDGGNATHSCIMRTNLFCDRNRADWDTYVVDEETINSYDKVVGGCVFLSNIQTLHNKTLDECKHVCDAMPACKGFEYGVQYQGVYSLYQAKDCNPQDNVDYQAGCDGYQFNLDLYIKKVITFPKYEGYNCMGSNEDLLPDFIGSLDECRARCVGVSCPGFVVVRSGADEGRCYIRGGTLSDPIKYSKDDRDCYRNSNAAQGFDSTVNIIFPEDMEVTLMVDGDTAPELTVEEGEFVGEWDDVYEDSLQFNDRVYEFYNVPDNLIGTRYFRGPCHSGKAHITVKTTGIVYVLVSHGIKKKLRNAMTISPAATVREDIEMNTDSFSTISGFEKWTIYGLPYEAPGCFEVLSEGFKEGCKNGFDINGIYYPTASTLNGKTAWRKGNMYLRWASEWDQWIFDDDKVDHTSVAWIRAPVTSSAPTAGKDRWRYGTTCGNNGVWVDVEIKTLTCPDGETYARLPGQYCGEAANKNHQPMSNWNGYNFDSCQSACDSNPDCASFAVTNSNWEGAFWCIHYTATECVPTKHANWNHYVKQGCPPGYLYSTSDVDGNGKEWTESILSLQACADVCTKRSGCTEFEYSSTESKCGTYTDGTISGVQKSNWQTCLKANPTYCKTYGTVTSDCNCHDCNCKTGYSCGCETSWRIQYDGCTYPSCGDSGCWCSPYCECCHTSNCAYERDCEQCCGTCSTTTCIEEISYSVNTLFPEIVPTTGASVEITGTGFVDSHTVLCSFGPSTSVNNRVVAHFVTDSLLRCSAPPMAILSLPHSSSTVVVEVSLDGKQWTSNKRMISYYSCPNDCSGHGTCHTDGSCVCDPGFLKRDCSVACPISPHSFLPPAVKKFDGCVSKQDGTGDVMSLTECQHLCYESATCKSIEWGVTQEGFTRGYCTLFEKSWSELEDGASCMTELDVLKPDGALWFTVSFEAAVGDIFTEDGTCSLKGSETCLENYGVEEGAYNIKDSTGKVVAHSVCCNGAGHKLGNTRNNCDSVCQHFDLQRGDICYDHGTCLSEGGCACEDGYFGRDCKDSCPGDVDNICSSHGKCQADGTCLCQRGYFGDDCGNECPGGADNICSRHGKCQADGSCVCQRGYFGDDCGNECPGGVANICSRNGRCLADGTCACNVGFVGTMCEHEGTCTGDKCTCGKGWFGDQCTEECPGGHNTPCNDHGTCSANGECFCEEGGGWWGSECENECPGGAATPCNDHGDCAASGECFCEEGGGWWGNECENECPGGADTPCNGHGDCGASGECFCTEVGWWGSACEHQCPGGHTNPCSGHGRPQDSNCSPNEGLCECAEGFWKDDCTGVCPQVNSNPCNDKGVCDSTTGMCRCEEGWFGEECGKECVKGKEGQICSGRGQCRPELGGNCTCNDGYYGHACEKECPGDIELHGQVKPCNGKGTCGLGQCACFRGYWGESCESECPGGSTSPCSDKGVCTSDGKCRCLPGSFGPDCRGTCPKGANGVTCGGNGVCDTNGKCVCNSGTQGRACEERYCLVADCNGHGVCQNTTGTCLCDGDWQGMFCSGLTDAALKRMAKEKARLNATKHGTIGFVHKSYVVEEALRELMVQVERKGGSVGDVNATLLFIDGTAQQGSDYFGIDGEAIVFKGGQTGVVEAKLLILHNPEREAAETFKIHLDFPAGGATIDANASEAIINISAHDPTAPEKDTTVQLTFRLRLPSSYVHENEVIKDFAEVTRLPESRFVVVSVMDENNSSAVGGQRSIVTMNILPTTNPSDGPAASVVVLELITLMATHTSALYDKERITHFLDNSYYPQVARLTQVEVKVDKSTGMPTGDTTPTQTITRASTTETTNPVNKGLLATLIILITLLVVGCIVGYIKREKLRHWLFWRLGSMHFLRFMDYGGDDEQVQEDEMGEMGDVPVRITESAKEGGPKGMVIHT